MSSSVHIILERKFSLDAPTVQLLIWLFCRARDQVPLPGASAAGTSIACQCILQSANRAIPAARSGITVAKTVPGLQGVQCNNALLKALGEEFTYVPQFCRYMQTLLVHTAYQ